MKVVQVLNHFLPKHVGGTEVYTLALSKYLHSKGINVIVVIPNYGNQFDNEYFYDNIKIHEYSEMSILDRELINGNRQPEGLLSFEKFLKVEQPDIVHFHELNGSLGIGLSHVQVAKKIGCKVIMTFHLASNTCRTGTMMYNGRTLCSGKILLTKCSSCYLHSKGLCGSSYIFMSLSRILFKLNIDTTLWGNKIGTLLGTVNQIKRLEVNFQKLLQTCDQVVTLTNWYTKVLVENNIDLHKITQIPQGLPYAAESLNQYNDMSGALKIIFIGRISHNKGLHLIISALDYFTEKEISLSIFGYGEGDTYESNLREKTKSKSNVFWRGVLPQNQVVDEMSRHSILCLCSTFSEMSPLVIQEAKAAGIPVLATNVYGNIEQIKDGVNGLLFDFNDIESLKNQIKRLIDDRNLLIHLNRNITKPRSFEEVGKEYVKLYDRVLLS